MDTVNTASLNEWVGDIQPLQGYAIHILFLSDLQRERNYYSYQRGVKKEQRPQKNRYQKPSCLRLSTCLDVVLPKSWETWAFKNTINLAKCNGCLGWLIPANRITQVYTSFSYIGRPFRQCVAYMSSYNYIVCLTLLRKAERYILIKLSP